MIVSPTLTVSDRVIGTFQSLLTTAADAVRKSTVLTVSDLLSPIAHENMWLAPAEDKSDDFSFQLPVSLVEERRVNSALLCRLW